MKNVAMNISIDVYNFFKGSVPIRSNAKKIAAVKVSVSSHSWPYLSGLDQTPMCKSDKPNLDEIRGASFVIARVTNEATQHLGLHRAGWYKTDFPLLNYATI